MRRRLPRRFSAGGFPRVSTSSGLPHGGQLAAGSIVATASKSPATATKERPSSGDFARTAGAQVVPSPAPLAVEPPGEGRADVALAWRSWREMAGRCPHGSAARAGQCRDHAPRPCHSRPQVACTARCQPGRQWPFMVQVGTVPSAEKGPANNRTANEPSAAERKRPMQSVFRAGQNRPPAR